MGNGGTDFTDSTRGALKIDNAGNNQLCGHLFILGYETADFQDLDQLSNVGTVTHDGQGNKHSDYQLNIINNRSDAEDLFAGISFYVGTDHPKTDPFNADKIGASIAAVRDSSANDNATLADHNLVFCTNDASDDGNKERLVIFHDGEVRAKHTISSSAFQTDGNITAGGTITAEQITSTDDIAVPATGKINLDGAGGHTYIQQSSSDVLDFYVGGDNMLKIDEGNNTTTLQGNLIAANPKFFAWKSSDQIILEDADRTIIFDTEIFDVGADYNVSNGIYTAPVSGKYNFSAQIRIDLLDIDANEIRISLVTSDATYRSPFDPNFSGDLNTYSYNINVLADMDANDTAYIAVFVADDRGNSTHVHGFNNVSFIDTFFSGHLVV